MDRSELGSAELKGRVIVYVRLGPEEVLETVLVISLDVVVVPILLEVV